MPADDLRPYNEHRTEDSIQANVNKAPKAALTHPVFMPVGVIA